jgi:hypothetical protein
MIYPFVSIDSNSFISAAIEAGNCIKIAVQDQDIEVHMELPEE